MGDGQAWGLACNSNQAPTRLFICVMQGLIPLSDYSDPVLGGQLTVMTTLGQKPFWGAVDSIQQELSVGTNLALNKYLEGL